MRDHQEVLLLRYYSDLSYNECTGLEHQMGTVMSRLSRAQQFVTNMGPDTRC